MWAKEKMLPIFFLTLTPSILILTHQQQAACENIVGKGEIACNKQFLLFTQCFLPNQIILSPTMFSTQSNNSISINIVAIFLFAAELEEPKIGISLKWLTTGSFLRSFNLRFVWNRVTQISIF